VTEPVENPTQDALQTWHRTFAPIAFNHTWALLDLDDLTREEEEDMLASTFAQRYHWYEVGTPRHQAIADWQVSRVLAVLGYAELALRFGERSLTVCQANELDAFVTGFAHEAIARAAADVDDIETFTEHLEAAKEKLAEIEDPEERDLLESDLSEMSER
jgi:hypothetical protein